MICVHILDAHCITLLLCEFPVQFFALMPLCNSATLHSGTLVLCLLQLLGALPLHRTLVQVKPLLR